MTAPATPAAAERESKRAVPASFHGLGAALPDFAIAAMFLTVWIAPGALPAKALTWCVLTMVLEFFIVHSAGFTGMVMTSDEPPHRKAAGMTILGGFYTLILGGIALSAKSPWLIVAFWALMLNRMLGGLFARGTERERRYVTTHWGASATIYVLSVGVTAVAPLPHLGLTRAVVAAEGFEAGGLWSSEPHRAVACGVLYFALVGLSEMFMHRWADDGSR